MQPRRYKDPGLRGLGSSAGDCTGCGLSQNNVKNVKLSEFDLF